jgi:hypothetical protein
MNTEAVYNAVPKRSVMPDEESLGERDPYVINDQIPAPEINDVEVGDSLHRASVLAEAVEELGLRG